MSISINSENSEILKILIQTKDRWVSLSLYPPYARYAPLPYRLALESKPLDLEFKFVVLTFNQLFHCTIIIQYPHQLTLFILSTKYQVRPQD